MRLEGAEFAVDIGFLGGDEHRRAFAALLRRAFEDNLSVLSGAELVEIRAARRGDLDTVALPLAVDASGLERLALPLYDSGNESVALVLQRGSQRVVLNVTFDNPSFWLSPFAV